MTRLQAVLDIIRDARRERSSVTSFKRIQGALLALDLTPDERIAVMQDLDYFDSEGQPYKWLAEVPPTRRRPAPEGAE